MNILHHISYLVYSFGRLSTDFDSIFIKVNDLSFASISYKIEAARATYSHEYKWDIDVMKKKTNHGLSMKRTPTLAVIVIYANLKLKYRFFSRQRRFYIDYIFMWPKQEYRIR